MRAADLRAGAALVVAALAADGVSEVDEICHIERGDEDIVEKLRGLGAGHQAGGKARGRAAAGRAVSLQKAEREERFGSFRF